MGSDDWAEKAWESSGMFSLACQTDGTNPLLPATVRKGRCMGRRTVIFMEMPTTPRGQEANHTDIKPNPGTEFEMHKPSRISTREATRMDNGPWMENRERWNRPRTG